jgi:hypothetical protein
VDGVQWWDNTKSKVGCKTLNPKNPKSYTPNMENSIKGLWEPYF